MDKHVDTALFVYTPKTKHLSKQLLKNPFKVKVFPVSLADFLTTTEVFLVQGNHVVFSGPQDDFKRILRLALQYDFSLGLVPTSNQKQLSRCYDLTGRSEATIDRALRSDEQVIDLILCNDEILLFKATVGRLHLLYGSQTAMDAIIDKPAWLDRFFQVTATTKDENSPDQQYFVGDFWIKMKARLRQMISTNTARVNRQSCNLSEKVGRVEQTGQSVPGVDTYVLQNALVHQGI